MAETYYVRSRGKISGPFDVESLQKLVRRGMLSRAQEVSSDRQAWSSAGDLEELFPQSRAVASDSTRDAAATTTAPATDAFHYVQNGQTVGPVSLAVLASLVRAGAIRRDDVIWSDGGQTAQAAGQVPALAALFDSREGQTLGYSGGGSTGRAITSSDEARWQQVLSNTRTLAQVAGIVCGCVLLLFLNLPLASAGGNTVWWWDALKSPDNGPAGIAGFFLLFAGVGSVAVGAAVHGLVRGWIFFGLATSGFLLLLVIGLYQPHVNAGFAFSLSVPFLAACLIGVLYFRGSLPQVRLGALFGGIIGGLLAGATLISTIIGVVNQADMRDIMTNGALPGWAVMALTLGLIGVIAALAAGILGLVGLKPIYTPGLNWTAVGAAIASFALPALAVLVAAGGAAGQFEAERSALVVFIVFRVLAIFSAFLALLAVGLAEVFVASHIQVRPRGTKA